MRIYAIGINTFREAARDKVLYLLLLFAGVTIAASKALGWISIGQDNKIIVDITLASISVYGALISIFVGTNLVYKEMDKRTLYTILSQPLARYEFILGKYLGLSMLIAVVTLTLTCVSVAYIRLLGGVVTITFFEAVFLIYVQLLLITALSTLLSSLVSPILGSVIVFTAYVFGHATGIFKDLPPMMQDTFSAKILGTLYYIVPNMSIFDIRADAANMVAVSPAYVLWAVLYGTVYTTMLLFFSAMAFDRKDV